MGEVTDNVSLATALETIWATRIQDAATPGASPTLLIFPVRCLAAVWQYGMAAVISCHVKV